MNLYALSSVYSVRKLGEEDIDRIYELSLGNPMFYRFCPPDVTRESIRADLKALPPRTTYEDKFYVGFFDGALLVAVMDLILHYPNEKTAFVGLFMVAKEYQGRGVGSWIVRECFDYLNTQGFSAIRLCFAKGNPQSEAFWRKNGLVPTGLEVPYENYTAVVMERELKRTTVYFVRHAQPNFHNHDDQSRELTEKGLEDRKRVTAFLMDKHVDAVLSSPFKRAVDTVKDFADQKGLEIQLVEDFRERRVDSQWIEDFDAFARRQWADFDYRYSDGENLGQVQRRNIAALEETLSRYSGKTVVIGSHGTAMSTVLHFYDPSFDYGRFLEIKDRMPWVVKLTFAGKTCLKIEYCEL